MSKAKTPGVPVHAVVWLDAAYGDTEKVTPVVAVTMGVILERTEHGHILVASEMFGDATFRHYTAIPMGMVKRVERVGRLSLPELIREQPEEEEDDAT
jgi:hypothetical protein